MRPSFACGTPFIPIAGIAKQNSTLPRSKLGLFNHLSDCTDDQFRFFQRDAMPAVFSDDVLSIRHLLEPVLMEFQPDWPAGLQLFLLLFGDEARKNARTHRSD